MQAIGYIRFLRSAGLNGVPIFFVLKKSVVAFDQRIRFLDWTFRKAPRDTGHHRINYSGIN